MGEEGAVIIQALNSEALLWASRMAPACLSGCVGFLVVWAVCRLVPRLPASAPGWLWWLACLKLVLDAGWIPAPLSLPILPAAPIAHMRPAASFPAAPLRAGHVIASRQTTAAQAGPALGDHDRQGVNSPAAVRLTKLACLQLIWLGGVLLGLSLTLRQGLRQRRLVRAASPTLLPEIALDSLTTAIGLRHAPRVWECPEVTHPCVTGLWRPVILLPPGLAQSLSADELRLALAHEMAHLRRGDLPLALLPAVVCVLFFFHPLVWLACAEWAAAREEACDALALQATGATAGRYGSLLLKMAGGHINVPALGLSPGFHSLKRRLLGLTRPAPSSRQARWLLALALPLLLPWRLTAASRTHSLAPTAEDTSATRFAVTDLGEVTDGGSEAAAVNNAGQVAGTALNRDDAAQGFAWAGGLAVPLGALPKHHYSIAYGINAGGQIAAASYNIPGHGRAFLWNGVPHRLGSLPGFPYSEARGVNDSGHVAGFAETGSHDRWKAMVARAFLWTDGEMTDLGTLGGPYSYAYGLNNSGTVVGKADTSVFGQTHAFAWTSGQMTDLGTLGGANSLAYRVNDSGQIVGSSETGDADIRHAFLWTTGQMRDLGTLPGMADSVAYDLNSQGDVVGCAQPSLDSPIKRAFLWHNGRLTDLTAQLPARSGWTLEEARAINDKGQIAGSGTLNGKPYAFLLTPHI